MDSSPVRLSEKGVATGGFVVELEPPILLEPETCKKRGSGSDLYRYLKKIN